MSGHRIDNYAAERMVNQLVSLCACLKEKPFIQIQGGSDLTKQIARSFMQKINVLYSDQSEDIDSARSSIKFNKDRALLLILDRSFDYCAPLAHDYNYWSLYFDLL